MRALVVSSVVAALLLSGCSDDEGHDAQPDRETAISSLNEILAGNNPNAEQSRAGACLADSIVNGAGTDALVNAGVLNEDLSASDDGTPTLGGPLAEFYVDALLECRDVSAEFAARKSLYPDLTSSQEQEYLECAGSIEPKILRPALLASLTGAQDEVSDASRQKYIKALAKCEKIIGEPTSPD